MFKFCLSGQITNLELEICTIKTQLEENLHHSIKNASKGELNRDVEYELDCLSGIGRSFGKKTSVCMYVHVQHYTGIIAPHVPSSISRPRSLSTCTPYLINPSQSRMNLPFFSPATSTPLSPLSDSW